MKQVNCANKILILLLCFLLGNSLHKAEIRSERTEFKTLEEGVDYHLKNYPEGCLIDIYKSFFQDKFGPGHLKSSMSGSKAGIDRELSNMDSWGGLDYEPAGLGENFIRVNLGLIKEGRISEEVFVEAFAESLEKIGNTDGEAWAKQWEEIDKIISDKDISFKNLEEDKIAIGKVIRDKTYRMDHSEDYNKHYNFHYRIIYKPVFEEKIYPYLIDEVNGR